MTLDINMYTHFVIFEPLHSLVETEQERERAREVNDRLIKRLTDGQLIKSLLRERS